MPQLSAQFIRAKIFLKKFFRFSTIPKKYTPLIFAFLGFIIILLPSQAHAEPITLATLVIAGIVTGVVAGAATAVAGLLVKGLTFMGLIAGGIITSLALGKAFLWSGTQILNWGINGPISSWSMTNPAHNDIINIGWTFLRDFTNMFFILGLAYIGLATALSIGGFNTKKTFFRFLLFALLINFTPVICGVIIDATNIITNFLVSDINFQEAAKAFEDTAQHFQIPTDKNTLAQPNWALKFIMLQVYSVLAGVVLWIFGFIFLLRHFIVWLLVVISPMAFFAGIFDFSNKWYKKWWNTFTGWALVAIPAAFFLYLGNHLLILAISGQIPVSDTGLTFFAKLTPYFLAIAFMLVGLITTLKIKVAGSGFIMGAANRVVKGTAAWPQKVSQKLGAAAGARAGAYAGGAVAGAGLAMASKRALKAGPKPVQAQEFQKWAQGHHIRAALKKANRFMFGGAEEFTAEERAQMGKGYKVARGIIRGITSVPTGFLPLYERKIERAVTPLVSERSKKAVEEQMAKTKGKIPERQKQLLRDAPNIQTEIGALLAIAGDGNLDDVGVTNEEVEKVFSKAIYAAPDSISDLKNINPVLFAEVVNKHKKLDDYTKSKIGVALTPEDSSKYSDYTYTDASGKIINFEPLAAKIVAEMKASKVGYLDSNLAKQLASSDIVHKFWNGSHISKAADQFGMRFLRAFQEGVERLGEDWYQKNNTYLYKYLQSSAAQVAGIGFGGKGEEKGALAQLKKQLKQIEEEISQTVMEGAGASGTARNLYRAKAKLEQQIEDLETEIRRATTTTTQAPPTPQPAITPEGKGPTEAGKGDSTTSTKQTSTTQTKKRGWRQKPTQVGGGDKT